MESSMSLEERHQRLGARFTEIAGRPVPRNYGDPAAEYDAVRKAAGVIDRGDRAFVRVTGRDPVRMVQGLVTNDVAGAAEGQGVYAAILTPKGKMVGDVRVFRRPGNELLLDLDVRARDGVLAHLKKFVPPLFARFEDVTDTLGAVGIHGPRAREIVGAALGAEFPEEMEEDAFVDVSFEGVDVIIARTEVTGGDGYDVIAPREMLGRVWDALVDAGARPFGHATLEVLRIEAGRPRWGAELDETVIPIEAGLQHRAISQTKGCYTGQEVIIRILHRGRVNWHLRGVKLGDAPAPASGLELFREGVDKAVGRITSACHSPIHEQTVALAYVRREVVPPATLRLGAPDGPEVTVHELPIPLEAGAGE